MGIEKAEIKRGTAHEIGVMLDDALDIGKRNVDRLEGSHASLLLAVKTLEGLMPEVDLAIDEKQLDLSHAKIAKTWVSKAMAKVAEMATNAKREQLTLQGKVQGLTLSVVLTKKVHDIEDAKTRPSNDSGRRRTGEKPKAGVKTRRAAKKALKKRK